MSNPTVETSPPAIAPITGSQPFTSRSFSGSGLFLKFFLGFWAAVVLTGLLVALYSHLYHFVPENRRMFRMGQDFLEENGQMIVAAYENQGIEAALKIRLPGMMWLFDENLHNLFVGFPRPPRGRKARKDKEHFQGLFSGKEAEIKAVAAQILSGDGSDPAEVAGESLIGCLIVSESQKNYVLISHMRSRMRPRGRLMLEGITSILPIFLLVTALFCFALSRYMVKPIAELRAASRKFARGDLSARASNGAEKRFDEIGDLAVDFNDMADKISTMILGQRRLFGDISHELRSPLARLQVAVEILQTKVAAAQQPMLSRIETEIARMNALIEEVLQFSKLESAAYDGVRQTVDLSEALQKICHDADFEGQAKNCKVVLQNHAGIKIVAVPNLIERALENILRNAVKYSPENSEVVVNLGSVKHQAVVTIIDNGPGVAEAELEKLFAPFYRCQEDRDRKSGGIGLGLAIAHRAVKLHEGEIILQNLPKGGLLATIHLPLA